MTTLSAAIDSFLATRANTAEATRRTYFYELRRFSTAFPERALDSITLPEIEQWLTTVAPGHAHNIARRLRTAYRYWHRRYGCTLLAPQSPFYRRKGYTAWEEADVKAFQDCWPAGTLPRAVMEAALATGLRRNDLVKVLWSPTAESLQTSKTYAHVSLGMLADSLAKYPVPADSRPMKAISLGLAFRLWARAAGVWKPLHGLRKLAAQRAAEAGCTGPELCALFGWASLRIAEVYIRQSPALAKSALAKLAG